MKTSCLNYIFSVFVMLLLTWTLSCSGRPEKKSDGGDLPSPEVASVEALKLIKLVSPEENAGYKIGKPVEVVIEPADNDRLPDSIVVSFNGSYVTTIKSAPWKYSIPPAFTAATGRKSLKVIAFKGGKSHNTITHFVVVFSDIIPARNGYRVVHTFPHDRDAFTQGLVYDNGYLYEGTGQETGSSLREVELQTGKILRQHNLESSLFGEGITLFNDRIYQVTWQSKVGFIYEKSTFKMINKIYYPTQGWGLTTVDNKIVMSDGTNVLSFYEPEMFTAISRLEVYDNEKKVDSLNELEYINGEIWANIWLSDRIARIDPLTGKVIAYIDLAGILPQSDRASDTDVLNGIAYDQAGKRIFVTGKKWPKLFEITITE